MSEPFVAEIRMFGGTFAPQGWAFCDGQLLLVGQNDALFSLVGDMYGGDGRTTFGLPDLRGRIPIGFGQGPGLARRNQGQLGGVENVTLTLNEIPAHTHVMKGSTGVANVDIPNDAVPAIGTLSFKSGGNSAPMADTTESAGSGQRHSNLMPFQCVNYIIALFGVYPSRT